MKVSGEDVYTLAEQHLAEKYVYKVIVPKNDPFYKGPWDCAELVSWVLYQLTGNIIGCRKLNPLSDSYTGSFNKYALKKGLIIPAEDAYSIKGSLLLRVPLKASDVSKKQIGHIAISDGCGKTVEANMKRGQVSRCSAYGRNWSYGILIPNIIYSL